MNGRPLIVNEGKQQNGLTVPTAQATASCRTDQSMKKKKTSKPREGREVEETRPA